MEMFTISSTEHILQEKEGLPIFVSEGMYPEKRRPQKFSSEKKVVVLTSRVHPGETPGSYVLNGLLEKVTDLVSPEGALLRKHYVFKVIQSLNPDGVARGYYRLDTLS